MQVDWKSKFLAMVTHLGISLVLIGALLTVMFTQWFPDFYFSLDGGWNGLKIVIAVDLILGPLLTFCVFRYGKPGLALDLTLIAIMQLAGFFYGGYIIYESRPLALVFVREAFYVLSADLYKKHDIPITVIEKFPGDFPKQIAVDLIALNAARDAARMVAKQSVGSGVKDKKMILQYEFYQPLEQQSKAVFDQARYVLDLIKENPEYQDEYNDFFDRNGGEAQDYAFLPVYSRYNYYLLGINMKEKRGVDTLKIPYPFPNELITLKKYEKRQAKKEAEK